MTNEEVLARSRMSTLSAMIIIKRLKWFGHILMMNDDRLALRIFTWVSTEKYRYAKRAPGGQRKTLMDQIEEDCSRNNMSYITLRQKAKRESKSCFNSFVELHFLDYINPDTLKRIYILLTCLYLLSLFLYFFMEFKCSNSSSSSGGKIQPLLPAVSPGVSGAAAAHRAHA